MAKKAESNKINPDKNAPTPVKTIKNDPWVDIKGEALYRGAIVAVPFRLAGNNQDDATQHLGLGFVTKMTTKTIYVTVMHDVDGKGKTRADKYSFPRNNIALSLIDRKQLKLLDKFHEAVRFAAGSVVD